VERAFVHVDHETTHYPVRASCSALAENTKSICAVSGTSKDTLDALERRYPTLYL
jgi:hypothetical protein